MGTILRGLLVFVLWGLMITTATAISLSEAGKCVVAMAQEMQSLPKDDYEAYRRFALRHVDFDTITAAAVGTAWNATVRKQPQWKQAALTEVIYDTIGTLRGIQVGKISRPIAREATTSEGVTYFIVNGLADGIEVIVHVDNNCKVREAFAAQVRASERIQDRIRTMYPEK